MAGGLVTGVGIYYTSLSPYTTLYLTSEIGNFDGSFLTSNDSPINNSLPSTFSANTLTFTPNIPVPGPLPLFGAAAAFGWSRRLRRSIQPPA